MDITYTLCLTITKPIRIGDYDETIAETAEWMSGAEAKRGLEKEVLRSLRVLDGDCDCEVMDTEIKAEE